MQVVIKLKRYYLYLTKQLLLKLKYFQLQKQQKIINQLHWWNILHIGRVFDWWSFWFCHFLSFALLSITIPNPLKTGIFLFALFTAGFLNLTASDEPNSRSPTAIALWLLNEGNDKEEAASSKSGFKVVNQVLDRNKHFYLFLLVTHQIQTFPTDTIAESFPVWS